MAKQVVEIWGMNEIMNVIDGLPQALKYKFVQDTYAKTLNATVVKVAKRLVPVSKTKWDLSSTYKSRQHEMGNLKRSIGVVRGNNRKYPTVFAGPRSKSANFKGGPRNKDDGWYAHMIEFGHWLTTKERSGNQSQLEYVQPQPFMRPAWDQTKNTIEAMIGQSFGKVYISYIKRETRKLSKSR